MTKIAMSGPDLTAAELEAVQQVLRTPSLSIGPRLDLFERSFAHRTGSAYAAGVNSGTSGLHLAVLAAGVQERDLVITTPFSFVASANVILYERAVPIFVDVEPATGNLDAALVAECVADLQQGGRRAQRWLPPQFPLADTSVAASHLRALLPVHVFGQPADMDPIVAVARENGLAVIEDACEAVGAEYKGRQAGTLGDAGVFAFYPNKQMTTGEGGMLVTNRADWHALFRSLRNQGRDGSDAWLNHTRLGYNYRLDELSAALGLAQLERLEELLRRREQVAAWYAARLGGHELVQLPHIAATTTRVSWFVYVVRITVPGQRDFVMQALAKEGIPSRPYFPPIHLQPVYSQRFGFERGMFPIAERLGDVSLALPFSSVITEDEVDTVSLCLLAALEKAHVHA